MERQDPSLLLVLWVAFLIPFPIAPSLHEVSNLEGRTQELKLWKLPVVGRAAFLLPGSWGSVDAWERSKPRCLDLSWVHGPGQCLWQSGEGDLATVPEKQKKCPKPYS